MTEDTMQTEQEYQFGTTDTCGRCGDNRTSRQLLTADLSVHAGDMDNGTWFLCVSCRRYIAEEMAGEQE